MLTQVSSCDRDTTIVEIHFTPRTAFPGKPKTPFPSFTQGISLEPPAALGPDYSAVQRNLALELVRVTEAAALAAGRWFGKGDKNAADQVHTLSGL